ncbi:hypothetical protein [Haloarcula sp. 1CSR25-25]|uniref:hypothetical protein n=1 Tax=Haloarcula sp. 1CSR25-25 TaxID=2862545 RepID=UPI002893FE83|nr:hypothetical protein [Haloarcula sp. 1CSR25-25]MDT3436571.1 hypothetical protein [Haloarcula sp. 1CSR25-25]
MSGETSATLRKGDFNAPDDEKVEITIEEPLGARLLLPRADIELTRPGVSFVTIHADLTAPEAGGAWEEQ